MNECMKEWLRKCMDERTNEWRNEGMNEWRKWMHKQLSECYAILYGWHGNRHSIFIGATMRQICPFISLNVEKKNCNEFSSEISNRIDEAEQPIRGRFTRNHRDSWTSGIGAHLQRGESEKLQWRRFSGRISSPQVSRNVYGWNWWISGDDWMMGGL